jgi:hypothetical protein
VIRLERLDDGLRPPAEETIDNDDVRVAELLEQQHLHRPHGITVASELHGDSLDQGRPGLASDLAVDAQAPLGLKRPDCLLGARPKQAVGWNLLAVVPKEVLQGEDLRPLAPELKDRPAGDGASPSAVGEGEVVAPGQRSCAPGAHQATSPPTIVIKISIVRRSSTGTDRGSAERITKSASFPGTRLPRSPSSMVA